MLVKSDQMSVGGFVSAMELPSTLLSCTSPCVLLFAPYFIFFHFPRFLIHMVPTAKEMQAFVMMRKYTWLADVQHSK